MNKYIDYLMEKLKSLELIDAAYLEKNRNILDSEYVHLIVNENNKGKFLKNIDCYFNELLDLIFWKCIYTDGICKYYLKFDNDYSLYIILENESYLADINDVVLYNKNNSNREKIEIKHEDIGEVLNHISYLLDTFNTSYLVKDKIKAMYILNDIMKHMIKFFNYNYIPEKIIHNYRECMNCLPDLVKESCIKILKKLKIDSLLECCKMMIVLLDEHISKVSINVAFVVNIDYYLHVKRNIFSH